MTVEERIRDKPLSMDTKTALIEEFDDFLWKMAIWIHRLEPAKAHGTVADWHQEAAIWFLHAANKWLPDHGAKFLTYAYTVVKRGLRRVMGQDHGVIKTNSELLTRSLDQRLWRRFKTVSLDDRSSSRNHDSTRAREIAAPEEEDRSLSDDHFVALSAYQMLPARWRTIIEERIVLEHTLDEIGAKRSITRERARQLSNEAVKRLREQAFAKRGRTGDRNILFGFSLDDVDDTGGKR